MIISDNRKYLLIQHPFLIKKVSSLDIEGHFLKKWEYYKNPPTDIINSGNLNVSCIRLYGRK